MDAKHTPAIFCRCEFGDCRHKSDCAVHNEPALEAGFCTCLTPAEKRALPNAHYSDGRRYSHLSNAWIFSESWNDREEAAYLRATLSKNSDRYLWLRSEEVSTNPIYYPFWEEFMAKLIRGNRMDALIDKWMDGVPEPEPENELLRDDGALGVGA